MALSSGETHPITSVVVACVSADSFIILIIKCIVRTCRGRGGLDARDNKEMAIARPIPGQARSVGGRLFSFIKTKISHPNELNDLFTCICVCVCLTGCDPIRGV